MARRSLILLIYRIVTSDMFCSSLFYVLVLEIAVNATTCGCYPLSVMYPFHID